ncbi:tRNA-modifying protein YgfZ [Thaumasiovibrio subtropicus]|uniref:tRNA-modifying protein YgfZ n=1 Tax=Thaumasiovibrio subtropicus TaxID=1891207 RepID=UPI000B35CA28|nr:tRNA-modifying protein YgfZ [Thaumasiovibrio subtropicus]
MSDWSAAERFQSLPAALPLPAVALFHLSEWDFITAIGADARSYLQGQFTCDLVSLPADSPTYAAHCDAKGKMHTAMRLCTLEGGYGYLHRRSVTEKQLTELKKYAIFSKIDFAVSEQQILGLAGDDADTLIAELFDGEGDVRTRNNDVAFRTDNRWVLIASIETADKLVAHSSTTLCAESLWDYLEIQAASPRVDAQTYGAHIPQAFNLQSVGGISFTKGCYTGQEMVARAKYRGANKRAMYIIEGKAKRAPNAGDDVERQVGENWRRGGTIVAGCRLDNGDSYALVVLPNDLEADTALRLSEQPDDLWTIAPLPYALEDDS